MRSVALFAAALAVASASWPQWPAEPLSRVGASDVHVEPPQKLHAQRMMAEATVVAPTDGDIATTHIILWSSIAMVLTFFFAAMALANMPVEGDSMLFSKGKVD